MQITNIRCPENKYSIKCPYEMTPEGLTVHNTANDASAMSEISYMIGRPDKVSFHVAVDDYRIVTGLPFNRSCFASGDGKNGFGNRKTINIEICYSKSGGERFDEAEELCAEYIAYLLKQYNWGIDKVGKHQDRSGKYCPHRTLDYGWERFLDKIRHYLGLQSNPVDNSNIEKGSDEPVRVYANGSTREPIYADTDCTNKIGSLDPWEKCDCFGEFNGRAMVRYHINNTQNNPDHHNYKIGFAKWLGGIK